MRLILNCPLINQRYVVFDVETTGLYPQRGHRIIEIGAVAVDGKSVSGEFHTLINTGKKVTKTTEQLNGITNEMLVDQPSPEQVYRDFHKFIAGAVLVAHNAIFDVSFLRYEFGRLGMSVDHRHICTLKLSKKRYPHLRNHKLETVARHLLGELSQDRHSHRALDDARMVARIWLAMERK